MVTLVCALKAGGDFQPEHVQWLARQASGLVCITDENVPGVATLKPVMDLPGWWTKLNAFSPDVFAGDMLLMDLDTVVRRMPTMPAETTVLTDWNRPQGIGSGFVYVTAADRAKVWEIFAAAPREHMRRHHSDGDQGFIGECLPNAARWGDAVRSYKVHCRHGLPPGTDVVCFHGRPRPWAVDHQWVPNMTDIKASRDFRELILQHKGKRFCVMGGAPSIADDLAAIDADVYISANGRGVEVRQPDYVLAMDEVHKTSKVSMGDHIRGFCTAPIISPHGYADVRLSQWPQHPRWVLSGMTAIWAAFVMGAKVVYVAGVDAYSGDPGYIDEARKIARDVHCPVRVASGPLVDVWQPIDAAEKFGRYTPHSAIDAWLQKDGRIRIRARRECPVNGVRLNPGDETDAWRHDVHRLLKHRMVEEV